MDMKLWIDGKWTDANDGATFKVENPATGETVATVAKAGEIDVLKAVAAARTAFEDGRWSGLTPANRAKALWKLADLLESRMEAFARVESEDTGKPYEFLSLGADLPFCIDNLRFFAAAARDTGGHHAGEYAAGYTSIYRRDPVGVVGQIAPWNYPLLMGVWKIGPALAAGCTAVLKPATLTPRTALMLGELTAEAGIPDGVVNVVAGNVGQMITSHPDIRMVSLTGATETGKMVMKSAADTVKRVHLELGGKAPALVFEDADVSLVAEKLPLAAFCNSGQDCTAATRIICHESLLDDVCEAMTEAMGKVKVGDPFDPATQMGPLISGRHRDMVSGFVERAKKDGATVLTGGKALDGPGYFFEPTVITDVGQEAEIVQQEVFGPVITIQSFKDEQEAVAMSNDVVFGLASSVFTRDVARTMRVSRALEFGTVWVNDHLPLASETPHGGFKQSGFGKDLSAEAVGDYLVTKHVMINTTS
ncbi:MULTISPECIES: aminobutyraldehyde dehydrogenase [unclassified Pseudodesulfovibrio]|uniref:aminobutyraldehyde dehydrogenase n=1 Tax=unclassified Pseudodesulfovibrio TaxID=2661612 RepID=UPI000FEBCCCD|nr:MULTISPECIES: aminobutyraldehyde dehydrogenase [unclassified Pseudodesulfovibrio]MCJ2164370.1 aminobutyraldehyde dehydrogenase [Pseudodesulfovibrio sp. S3-i]RWU04578.1 aldehyde dehydrogenase family protein [Pseudodesulfovibrio sp. S3]